MVFIVVRLQVEGHHAYHGAPSEVSYLSHLHRHMFHIEVEVETYHDDRELEFIIVKNRLDRMIRSLLNLNEANELSDIIGPQLAQKFMLRLYSCEMVAKAIRYWVQAQFPGERDSINGTYKTRCVNVKVFEDGENGVYLVDR